MARKVYQSVPQQDKGNMDDPNFKFVPRQKVLSEDTSLLETIGNKLQALGWVIAAVAIWYYTDLWNILKTAFVTSETSTTDIAIKQLNFVAFYFALFLATIAGIAGGIVVIDIYKKRDGVGDEKDLLEDYPISIHVATFAGLFAGIAFIVSFWPVYGWKSIAIVSLTAMGSLMALTLAPF